MVIPAGTVSISPLDEMLRVRWRRGLPPVVRTLERGLVTSLSCDSESTSSGDMFSIMKNTLAVGRFQASNPGDDRPEPAGWNAASVISTRQVMQMATIEGAKTAELEKVTGSPLLERALTSFYSKPTILPITRCRIRSMQLSGRLTRVALRLSSSPARRSNLVGGSSTTLLLSRLAVSRLNRGTICSKRLGSRVADRNGSFELVNC